MNNLDQTLKDLKEAIETSDTKRVKEILNKSDSKILNEDLGDGQTALFLALEKGNLEMIEQFCLRAYSIDFSIKNKTGKSVVEIASEKVGEAKSNYQKRAQEILDNGGNEMTLHNDQTYRDLGIKFNTMNQILSLISSSMLQAKPQSNIRDKFKEAIKTDLTAKDLETSLEVEKDTFKIMLWKIFKENEESKLSDVKRIITATYDSSNPFDSKKFHLPMIYILNRQDSDGSTLLHLAAKNYTLRGGVEDVFKALLELGADPNIQDKYGDTPLHETASHDHGFTLLEKNPNLIQITNNQGETPLHIVAKKNGARIKAFVQSTLDVSPNLINAKDNKGNTALHNAIAPYAFAFGDPETWISLYNDAKKSGFHHRDSCVVVLVEDGKADVNAQNDDGDTPLHLATKNIYPVVTKYLIEHGAILNVKNKAGKTPYDIANELKSDKAEVQEKITELKKLLTPPEIKELLKKEEAMDKFQQNLFKNVSEKKVLDYFNMNESLITKDNIDMYIGEDKDKTLLCLAVEKRYPELVNKIIAKGADVSKKIKGMPLLWYVAEVSTYSFADAKGDAMLSKLLSSGASVDINFQDKAAGNTSLHHIAFDGDKALVPAAKKLVDAGANITLKNKEGHTALDLAREYKASQEMIEYLESVQKSPFEETLTALRDRLLALKNNLAELYTNLGAVTFKLGIKM